MLSEFHKKDDGERNDREATEHGADARLLDHAGGQTRSRYGHGIRHAAVG
jgi:hypothetical protein